jgi:DNA invertase Pin-like site-specific DNA recombinase
MARKHERSTQPSGVAVAYSYIRFSSPEQAKGDSIRRQTELRDAWVKKTGAVLDTSLTLRDEGVSAFNGAHRENPDRNALAAFLNLVKRGRIPRGSYLIVESLDRLSREHIRPALTLLLNLIESGVRIVQLLPAEAVYDEHVEPMNLMMAIMELSRGHSESRMKSERSGAAWAARKNRARQEGGVITRMTPPWLKATRDGYVLVEPAAEAVRRIFRLAREGYGSGAIAKKLNAERVPNIGRAPQWARSYVARLLANRATVGEYQPHSGRDSRDRRPDGPPIPNFYPAVVTEGQWHATRFAVLGRKGKAGRPTKRVNLFSGLMKDARDGGSIHLLNKTSGAPNTSAPYFLYVSGRAQTGERGSRWVSFPVDEFEAAVLSKLREIDPRKLLPAETDDGIEALAGRLAAVEQRIETVKASLVDGDDVLPLIDVLKSLEGNRRKLADELLRARQEAASPLSAAWKECGSLLGTLARAKDPGETRIRLRSAIRRVVSEIWCLFVGNGGRWRTAAVQVWFHGGEHRDYVILYRGGCGNVANRNNRAYWVRSFAEAAVKDGFDLRKRKDAAALERALAAVDVKKVG